MIVLIIFKIVGIPFESPHLLHLCFVLINQSRPAKPLIGAMLDGVRKDFKRCDCFPEFETCWSNSMWTDVFGYKQNMCMLWSLLINETMIRDDVPWWDCMIWVHLKKARVLWCWCRWLGSLNIFRPGWVHKLSRNCMKISIPWRLVGDLDSLDSQMVEAKPGRCKWNIF